jgi:ATP-dependent helicase/nuclease subunit B
MTTEEFHTLLDTGLDDIALGVIPPSLDQLTIGDIERTRLNHIQVLFVMGVNDGIIPKVTRGAGILSEADRWILATKLELAPNSRQQVFTEQFYLYQNITKPSRELYLTWHTQDSDGNEVLPAYLIGRLRKLFPKLSVEYPYTESIRWEMIETPGDSREVLVRHLHEEPSVSLPEEEQTVWKALYQYYLTEEPDVIERIGQGVRYHNVGQLLTPETARRLYGDWLNTSVSKLETYQKCPYQFFLEYGLKLHKREKNEVTLSDMGNLLHKAVETVFRHVETRKAGDCLVEETDTDNPWKTISDEELRTFTIETVEQIAQEEEGQIYQQTSANRQLLNRMKQTAAYAVVDLKEQLLSGRMIPYQFELTFNRKNADELCRNLSSASFQLEQGTMMRLNGIIDRIDICQDASNVYVKVLDYKSSRKELDATQVTAGLQLQLLIYTNVVLEVLQRQFPDKKIIPAGSLYYGFKVPMVERRAKEETTRRNIEKVTAMTGLVNEEAPCIQYMGSEELLPIQAAEKEDASEKVQYLDLLSQVQGTVKELGEDMINGQIPIRPVKTGRSMPCDFCDYQDVCKLDCKDGGNHVTTAEQLISGRRKEEL